MEEGYRLKFIFIGNQNNNIKNKNFSNPHNILFDSKKDIILTQDLCEEFLNLNINKQDHAIELLKKELSPLLFEDSLSYLKEEFINEKLEFNISNLASRYTANNDVDTINNKIIEGISITNNFKYTNISYLKELKGYIENDILDKMKSKYAKNIYLNFKKIFSNLEQSVNNYLELEEEFEEKKKYLSEIYELIDEINIDPYIFLTEHNECNIYKISENEKLELQTYMSKIEKVLLKYQTYLKETCKECLFYPYLLVQGEAGIGKSHLLAHLSKKLRDENHIIYLFLGQFFTKNEDPWHQILNDLEVTNSVDNFLRSISNKAKETKKRAFIIIDALNEGEGKRLWGNYFQSFINHIKKYSNIALIFSIRTPFEDVILPKNAIQDNNIVVFQHEGFSKEENYNPIVSFCDFYGLELPKLPILNPEFNNPLFLKLMCEYCVNKFKEFDQTISVAELFTNVLNTVNINLSKEDKFDFDKNINVVQKVIKGLVELMNDSEFNQLNYEESYTVVNNIAKEYVQKSNRFLEALIDENILIKNTGYKGEMIIYFSYERMGDYFLSEYLLEKYRNVDKRDLVTKLQSDEKVTRYFQKEDDLSYNRGLINELFIKLANEFNIELFEVFPQFKNNYNMIYSFINSLVWRKDGSISKHTKCYISDNVIPYDAFRNNFLDVLLIKMPQKNHPLNIWALHKLLKQCNLGKRDFLWTQYISINNEKVFEIINWLFSNYKKLDEETAEKYMIFLTWIFSATNNKLRDLGTKSLVKLFKTFPTKIIGLLKLFENNNDPYIVERLYASVLGATLRIDICEIHIEIANYIYEEIFDKEMVYPHILMRDYARQTIEYISLSKDISNINLEKIRPPYKSNWYKKEYSNLNIDDYIKSLKNKLDSHLHFSIDKIKNSMTTEYGRGTGAYGDFGRYVFGYAVRNWVKGFKSDQDLSNIALMRIFEMGYDAKLHGEFDMWVNRYDNFNNSIERISKKYQWIAYYEILAKLVDKFPDVQYSGLWDDYIRDIDPTLLLLEIDKESKILVPSPLPSHQSNEWVKNTKVFDETKLFLEIDIDNHRYICLSSKFNFEKREKEIPFEDRDSCYFLAMGYFYNKEDSNEIIKGYENNYDRGINIPRAHSIYLYEYYWSEAYKNYKEGYLTESDGKLCPAIYEYFWELDYSVKDKSISFYIPCKEIVDYFSLIQTEEGVWKTKFGETICINSKLLEFDNECLLIKKESLLNFLNTKKLSIGWKIYLEKISLRDRQEWWYNVFYDDGKYNKKIIKNDMSKIRRNF
ncbi:hypothetical protein ksw1_12130 [Staphylococcus aureus]|nr:hypothetical protein ksw1_12130 [Staphylococcus aureus]